MHYAAVVWRQAVSMSALEKAWRVTLDRVEAGEDKLTWASARGPLMVVVLSLKRIGWAMLSSVLIQPDVGP
eukprot:1220969-Pyramimonas_sp.AAC.1